MRPMTVRARKPRTDPRRIGDRLTASGRTKPGSSAATHAAGPSLKDGSVRHRRGAPRGASSTERAGTGGSDRTVPILQRAGGRIPFWELRGIAERAATDALAELIENTHFFDDNTAA